jgi:hypothetical protein
MNEGGSYSMSVFLSFFLSFCLSVRPSVFPSSHCPFAMGPIGGATGKKGPGGGGRGGGGSMGRGEFDGCIMHRVHTSFLNILHITYSPCDSTCTLICTKIFLMNHHLEAIHINLCKYFPYESLSLNYAH